MAPARFSKTIVYGGEVTSLGVHVVGYQNTVQNGGSWTDRLRGSLAPGRLLRRDGRHALGNAMLLHFPAAEPMTEANMLDTTACPQILQDMAAAIQRGPARSLGAGAVPVSAPDVVVFTRGVYDVVLARDARYVPDALEAVRADKRPPVEEAIFQAYSAWFPGWPIALCCFNTREAARAEPLLWWYVPRRPDLLFAPALDAHDGRVPRLNAKVDVDHTVIFGSDRSRDNWYSFETWVRYRDPLDPAMRTYLPWQVVGRQMFGRHPNGDFVYNPGDFVYGPGDFVYDPRRPGPARFDIGRVPPAELTSLIAA